MSDIASEQNKKKNKTSVAQAIDLIASCYQLNNLRLKQSSAGELDEYTDLDDVPIIIEKDRVVRLHLMQSIQSTLQIADPLSISQFLTPEDEIITENPEIILVNIVTRHEPIGEMNSSEDEKEKKVPTVSYKEALLALKQLSLYKKQQKDGLTEVMRKIDSIKSTLQSRRTQMAKQRQLNQMGFISKQLARQEGGKHVYQVLAAKSG
ncbi:hypothetical protein BDZ45DRAFT_744718 [Acephala macrosclerotiorum]|nr:hypothetical protein BDZ45DRAFT_744718 [Acephala macrosclerotiorum]